MESILKFLLPVGLSSKDWMDQTMKELGCSGKTFYDRKKSAIELGLVEPDGEQAAFFTLTKEGQAVVVKAKVDAACVRQNNNKHQFKNSK